MEAVKFQARTLDCPVALQVAERNVAALGLYLYSSLLDSAP
ncbi:hypothetical protein DEDE109153_06995 [Deinococcus deserti]